jgi:hypothetical protein
MVPLMDCALAMVPAAIASTAIASVLANLVGIGYSPVLG